MDKEIAKLYDAGETARAIHLLIKKIDAHPNSVDNYLQLSTYLLEQGSVDQAQKLLEEAMHLVKKPQELLYNLAVCYYSQGEFEKALKILDEIPNDDLTLYQKALVYLKLGRPEKALAYALTIKKQDQRTLELIADIWLNLGQISEAREGYLKIPENSRSAKVNFLLGVCFLEKDYETAQSYFKKSKQMDAKYYEQAQKQYANLLNLINNKGKDHD